jgi:hypothetical protein
MPVLINEFEVVPETEPPPAVTGAQRRADSDAMKKRETPVFEDVLRLWRDRAERVRAH